MQSMVNAHTVELEAFRTRLLALEKVIKHLQIIEQIQTPQLADLNNRLSILKTFIQNTDTLNNGGHFEWVDSKIVTALKSGQFICLEHVNLCSSAILDRLNSVFEPSGSLLLAEKGVTKTGQSERVDKHNNFRAYLTLDPKNGEISRAMRNRCIELSYNRETYTIDDMRQLIFAAGIRQTYIINCLMRIHERLQNISEHTAFGVSHCVKTAFLTAAHQKIGYTDTRAIYISSLEVYVRSSTMDLLGYGLQFYHTKLRNEIAEELQCITRFENIFEFENVILKPNQLNGMAMIKLQCEPFLTVCRGLVRDNDTFSDPSAVDGIHNLFNCFRGYNFENSEHFAKYLLYHLYEISTYDDVEFRCLYVHEILAKLAVGNDAKSIFVSKLLQYNKMFSAIVHQSAAIKSVSHKDLPWNTKLYPRLYDYVNDTDTIVSVSDQLKISAQLIAKFVIDEIATKKSVVLSEIDVITYSKAIKSQSITDKYNNEILMNLYVFLLNLPKYIEYALKNGSQKMDCKEYVDLLCSILWSNRIYKVTLTFFYL